MRTIDQIDLAEKRVFIRVDFNVPLRDGEVADPSRIEAAIPTIELLRAGRARPILASHLGRPKGRRDPQLSLAPVARWLEGRLGTRVLLAPEPAGPAAESVVARAGPSDVVLLENLRFHPGEEANDPDFARALARLAQVYVNDAFGSAHRAHASTVGMVEFVPEKAAGLLLARELDMLGRLLAEPERPFVCCLGGGKVSDKIGVIRNLLPRVDRLLIGGAMANTFLCARGDEVGRSKVDEDHLDVARDLLRSPQGERIHLPSDHVVAESVSAEARHGVATAIPPDAFAVDIGPQTCANYEKAIREAGTVFWNGPMGVFEIEAFAGGSVAVARAVGACQGETVVGGGDTLAVLGAAGCAGAVSHASTGGGASLEFLEGRLLPGIEALGRG